MKQCSGCQQWKPLDAFAVNKRGPHDMRSTLCRRCASEETSMHRQEVYRDPERHAAYKAAAARRARLRKQAKHYPSAAELAAKILGEAPHVA